MQGTNTTIFVEDHRSLFEEIVFVCINCMYVVSRICIQTRWSSPSLVEEINISRHIAASLLLKTLNWVLSKNCNRFTSNMAQAIQSFEIPWGGVKLNRQQRISILFNILFWYFYYTQSLNCVGATTSQQGPLPILKKLTNKIGIWKLLAVFYKL